MDKIQKEWNNLGSQYAKAVNDMVAFAEKNGWENWKEEDPIYFKIFIFNRRNR